MVSNDDNDDDDTMKESLRLMTFIIYLQLHCNNVSTILKSGYGKKNIFNVKQNI